MKDPRAAIYIAAGVLAYAGVLVAIVVWAVRRARRLYSQKAQDLAAGLASLGAVRVEPSPGKQSASSVEVEFRLQGRSLVATCARYGKYTDRRAIRAVGAVHPWVQIHAEDALDRIGKKTGLNRELQTGDAEFDAAAYVETLDDEKHAARLLAAPEVRREIRALMALGCRVQFSIDGVEAFQILSYRTPVDASKTAQIAEVLLRLAAAAPDFRDAGLKRHRPQNTVAFVALVPVVVGMIGAGLLSVFAERVLSAGSVAAAILGYGGIAWALFMSGLMVWARGRSYAARVVLIGGFLSLFAVPAIVGMTLVMLNEVLDHSAAVEHVATVRQFGSSKGNYWIYVDSWRKPGKLEKLRLPSGVAKQLVAGDRVPVLVHEGRLGWAWTERVTGKAP